MGSGAILLAARAGLQWVIFANFASDSSASAYPQAAEGIAAAAKWVGI